MTKTKIIGIDYSLSSPAICVFEGLPTFDNCKIYYLTNVKKYEGDFCDGKINGRPHLPYTSQTQRHDQISDWAISVVGNTATASIDHIFYRFRLNENYASASSTDDIVDANQYSPVDTPTNYTRDIGFVSASDSVATITTIGLSS